MTGPPIRKPTDPLPPCPKCTGPIELFVRTPVPDILPPVAWTAYVCPKCNIGVLRLESRDAADRLN